MRGNYVGGFFRGDVRAGDDQHYTENRGDAESFVPYNIADDGGDGD